ncbi:MAG: hypothetical protein ACKO3W_00015 [bacterium]
MRLFVARILIALLVLSQTWTGAMRGLELCIPLGQCAGCQETVESAQVHSHPHAHAHVHAHADAHAHASLDEDRHHAHHGDEGCICHIHVATPDDDTHRSPAPTAGFVVIADAIGAVEASILAVNSLEVMELPPSPPERDGPTRQERDSIATTVLLV